MLVAYLKVLQVLMVFTGRLRLLPLLRHCSRQRQTWNTRLLLPRLRRPRLPKDSYRNRSLRRCMGHWHNRHTHLSLPAHRSVLGLGCQRQMPRPGHIYLLHEHLEPHYRCLDISHPNASNLASSAPSEEEVASMLNFLYWSRVRSSVLSLSISPSNLQTLRYLV